MIGYFPSIYPDELVYSILSRYYSKSGYLAYTFAAKDLFINSTNKPDIEFINKLTPDAIQCLTHEVSFEDIIKRHTMFPYYARFIDIERRKNAFNLLMQMDNSHRNFLSIPKSKECKIRYLRYCPMCAMEDRNKYGETYWHRVHQMIGINICYIHKCKLHNSDIAINSVGSPSLISAEEIIPNDRENKNINFADNETEHKLSKYMAELLFSEIEMENDISLGKFLHSRLESTKYLSVRGEQRNMSLLHNDFFEYYKSLEDEYIMEQWQIQKVFSDNRLNTNEICMIAMFLNIPVSDLSHMNLPNTQQKDTFDKRIKEMHKKGMNYRQIANELNASYDVVKTIGEGRYGIYHYCSPNPQKSGSKRYNWENIDSETLPLVKQVIKQIIEDKTKRPQRITIGLIERTLNLPDKYIGNCPMCKAEIEKYKESQEEHWARTVIWAAKQIISNNEKLNLSSILRLTNIRKADLEKCISYIDRCRDCIMHINCIDFNNSNLIKTIKDMII